MGDYWVKVSASGKHQGPFSRHQLKQLVDSDQLQPEHLVSSDDGETWDAARQFSWLEFPTPVLDLEESSEVVPPTPIPLKDISPAISAATADVRLERPPDSRSRLVGRSARRLYSKCKANKQRALILVVLVGFLVAGVIGVVFDRVLLTLEGHSRFVTSVNFSPDGKRIVSGGGDKTVKVWDISSLDTSK
jgi:WD40 repeat protein